MSSRKPRPLWPLFTAALIALPVLYIASFGFLCWVDALGLMSQSTKARLEFFYIPLTWLVQSDSSPGWLRELIVRYVQFWYSL